MDPITLLQPELAFEESLEKIFNWSSDGKYANTSTEIAFGNNL